MYASRYMSSGETSQQTSLNEGRLKAGFAPNVGIPLLQGHVIFTGLFEHPLLTKNVSFKHFLYIAPNIILYKYEGIFSIIDL